MASKRVRCLQERVDTVLESIETHASAVQRCLTEWMEPVLEDGEVMPDVEKFLLLLGRKLANERRQLTVTDDAYTAAIWRSRSARMHRQRLCLDLRRRVIEIRQSATRTYGRQAASAYLGLAGKTPRSPHQLQKIVEALLGRLEDPERTPPKARLHGADPASWAAVLNPVLRQLRTQLTKVGGEQAKCSWFQAQRRRMIQKLEGSYLEIRHFVEAVYSLAEMGHLARELRPDNGRPPRQTVRAALPPVAMAKILRHPSASF